MHYLCAATDGIHAGTRQHNQQQKLKKEAGRMKKKANDLAEQKQEDANRAQIQNRIVLHAKK